jgi:hypothetical protein
VARLIAPQIRPADDGGCYRPGRRSRGSGGKETPVDESVRGGGWLFFAGIMVFIAGVLNCIWGVAAIDNAHFFIEDKKFIISDLNTWGWIILFVGIIQLIAAFSIWAGGEFGRWIGLIGASLSAIGALLSIRAYPFWSLCIFGVDILIIYGLAAYGGHQVRERIT